MHCKQYNINQRFWSAEGRAIIGRMTADTRRFFDKMSSTDRLDDRANFGRYYDVNFFKKSTDCRPIIGRPSPDASPMTKLLKIVGSVNETFNLGASTNKVVGRPKNQLKSVPTTADNRPTSPDFPHVC